jgi:DNA-binding transcriptional regulator YhcF (GntR family)
VPAVREIADHAGIAPSLVQHYLRLLAARGAVTWAEKRSRTLRTTGPLE